MDPINLTNQAAGTNFIGFVPIAISLLALGVSVYSWYTGYLISQKANYLPILVTLFQELRSKQFKDSQNYVIHNLGKDCNPKDGYWQLNEKSRDHVIKVSFFMDLIGLLVAWKIIDQDIIISFMGNTILTVWNKLYPFLEGEKENRRNRGEGDVPYQEYFEDLVWRIKRRPPSYIVKVKLRLHKL